MIPARRNRTRMQRMTTIGLTKSARQTVTLLDKLSEDFTRTSTRLDSGNAVNSAVDDPAAYFTARSFTEQAARLECTVDELGQGIQVVSAADNGLTTISNLLDNAKGAAAQAASSDSVFERIDFAKSYNAMLDNMVEIAQESSYAGKNLLLGAGHELGLYFGDGADDKATIGAIDYTNLEETLGLGKLDTGATDIENVTLGDASLTATTRLVDTAPGLAVGDEITLTKTDASAGTTDLVTLKVTDETTVGDLMAALNRYDDGLRTTLKDDGTLEIEAAAGGLSISGLGAADIVFDDARSPDWLTADDATATGDDITAATQKLRQHAASIGNSLAMLQKRSDFMETFTSTLQASSSTLTASDRDEEAARLVALQTRQQLASNMLSLSGSLDSGILRLLGA